mgnify:CR=1 FL=1
MYKNDGGDIIQERLKSKLIKNPLCVLQRGFLYVLVALLN